MNCCSCNKIVKVRFLQVCVRRLAKNSSESVRSHKRTTARARSTPYFVERDTKNSDNNNITTSSLLHYHHRAWHWNVELLDTWTTENVRRSRRYSLRKRHNTCTVLSLAHSTHSRTNGVTYHSICKFHFRVTFFLRWLKITSFLKIGSKLQQIPIIS